MVAVATLGMKKFSKMKQTRKTVTDDLDMLRRRDGAPSSAPGAVSPGSADALTSDDGTLRGSRATAEIPAGRTHRR